MLENSNLIVTWKLHTLLRTVRWLFIPYSTHFIKAHRTFSLVSCNLHWRYGGSPKNIFHNFLKLISKVSELFDQNLKNTWGGEGPSVEYPSNISANCGLMLIFFSWEEPPMNFKNCCNGKVGGGVPYIMKCFGQNKWHTCLKQLHCTGAHYSNPCTLVQLFAMHSTATWCKPDLS